VDEVQGQYIGLLRFTPEGWTEVVRIHSTLSAGERDRMYMTGTLQGVVDAGQLAITVISYAVDWDEFASVGDLHTSKRLAWPE